MNKKTFFKRAASIMLAVMMVFSMLVVVNPQEVGAASDKTKDLKTLKKSKTQTVSISDDECYGGSAYGETWGIGKYYYIKFKPNATGYVTVKASNNSKLVSSTEGNWGLCNSKKSALSSMLEYNTVTAGYNSNYYGVKKNTVYYLKVQAFFGTKISLKLTALNDAGGSKKSKAVSIKKGGQKTGLIVAGDTSTNWYKVKLSSNQVLKIDIMPHISGTGQKSGLKVTIKGPGIYDTVDTVGDGYNGKTAEFRWGTGGKSKVKKGTYYIQVKPSNKGVTGYYKVKWAK